MSTPVDPALEVVAAYLAALRMAFNPDDSIAPPSYGGTKDVRFFAGDAPALAAFEAHAGGGGENCGEPFVWVRLMRRYRSKVFPAAVLDMEPGCGTMRVVAVEVGVGRCAVVDMQPTWDQYDSEADRSLEDSYRIELALCVAARQLRDNEHRVATDTINPYGPEGGVIAWIGTAYVDLLEES